MPKIGVLGLGSVGLRTSYLLKEKGYDIVGLDSSNARVTKARNMGINALLFDVEGGQMPSWLEKRKVATAVVALPTSVAERVVAKLASRGIPMVVVTVKPLSLKAEEGSNPSILLEAGLSPGISNLVAYSIAAREGGGSRVRVLVGSFGNVVDNMLSHSSTWSTLDMLEQYLAEAMAIQGGIPVKLNPLDESHWGLVEDPVFGRLECFPSQGLGGFIERHGYMFEELMECSVRRPGHLQTVRTLYQLGLLDKNPMKVSGCIVSPVEVTAELIRRRYPSSMGDSVLFTVEKFEDGRWVPEVKMRVYSDPSWTATSKAVGGAVAGLAELFIDEGLAEEESGIIYPETLYELGLYERLLSLLPNYGVVVEKG